METNNQNIILETIGKVYDTSKDCMLDTSFFIKIDPELTILSEYFGISKNQSLLVSMVFTLNYKEQHVDLNSLIKYFNCNPIGMLPYQEDFNFLIKANIFKSLKPRFTIRYTKVNIFELNESVSKAILHNLPMPVIELDKPLDFFEFLEKIHELVEQRSNNNISTAELFHQTEMFINDNLHLSLVQKIVSLKLEDEDTFLFFFLVWKTTAGYESIDLHTALEDIFDKVNNRMNYMQQFLSGKNILVKHHYITILEANFFNNAAIKLSDLSNNLLKECGVRLFIHKLKNDQITESKDICEKQLIFNKSEMKQLFILKDLLYDEKFKQTQKRLSDKNLPTGITVLLHGAPGTGKTEIVKQIAKATNRDLMTVDISESKSKWFGESEKIIKKIFTDYKLYAKECERIPILLFNEADALITKRQEIKDSNTIQSENAIQNILLEEIEKFEGIMMATTNLTNNMDTAFERRFLFKIPFPKPNIAIKKQIWKLKLPSLSKTNCFLLASKFDFSGGQIDNIVRKNEIQEIVTGKKVNLNTLIRFCEEETLINTALTKTIGFSR